MSDRITKAEPILRPWRPRFSLRTLVLGVLTYTSLWTATEICGGGDFRARIEGRSEALRRATAAWCATRAQEGDFWASEGFFFPAEEPSTAGNAGPIDPSVSPTANRRRPSPSLSVGGPRDVTSFCDVETLAVAPFLLRVRYTYACVDGQGKSLPVAVPGLPQAECEANGWVFWFFGHVSRIVG